MNYFIWILVYIIWKFKIMYQFNFSIKLIFEIIIELLYKKIKFNCNYDRFFIILMVKDMTGNDN